MTSTKSDLGNSTNQNSVVAALALVLGFFYTLVLLPPWIPAFLTSAEYRDPSWQYMLHEGFVQELEFGRDIIFTYGPLGFLTTQMYHPETFSLMLMIWTGLSILFFAVTWTMARRFCQSPWTALLLTAVAVRVAFVDSMIFFFAFIVLLVGWRLSELTMRAIPKGPPERGTTALTVLLVIAVGILPLTKYTFVPAVFFILAAFAAMDLQQRRWPWHSMLALLGLLVGWCLCGQPLSGLQHYLVAGFEVASKYVDAMANWETEPFDIAMVIIGAALIPLVPLGGRISFAADKKILNVGYPFILFTLMFLVFKFTFVGYHGHKLSIFYASAFLMGLYSLMATNGEFRFLHRRHVLTAAGTGGLLIVGVVSAYARFIDTNHSVASLTALGNPQNPAGMRAWLAGDSWMKDQHTANFQDIRARYPLPELEGTIDVVPDQLALGIASDHATFVPRPLLHTYATHSEWLAEQNAAHYRSENAPDNVLFRLNPLIGRYPTLNDGRLWLELLRSYEVKAALPSDILLCRKEQPRKLELELLKSVQTTWNSKVDVPVVNSGVIWCRVRVRRNLTGKFASFAYKLPELMMDVTHDGGTRRYRFTSASGESGFILSPRIDHRLQLAELLQTGSTSGKPALLPAVDIHQISFRTAEVAEDYCYNAGISIDFEHVIIRDDATLADQATPSRMR